MRSVAAHRIEYMTQVAAGSLSVGDAHLWVPAADWVARTDAEQRRAHRVPEVLHAVAWDQRVQCAIHERAFHSPLSENALCDVVLVQENL